MKKSRKTSSIKSKSPSPPRKGHHSKQQQHNYQHQLDMSSSFSKKVPTLDLKQLDKNAKGRQQNNNNLALASANNKESANRSALATSSHRSIFERNSFQDMLTKHGVQEEFNINNYPEMLRIREEAIGFREKMEQKYINKMFKQKQLSPTTYKKKQKELEVWVTKEREEVKKTKKVFEEELQKTAKMIKMTQ